MSFEDLISKAGSFVNLFRLAREAGTNIEEELQKAMSLDSDLFRQVGYRVSRLGEGTAELTFPYSEVVSRRGGIVHGGIIMYSLDNASGLAVMTVNPGTDQLTVELKVNFLEPLKNGPFTVAGKVIRRGKELAVAQGEVTDAEGRLCATSLGTWYMNAGRR